MNRKDVPTSPEEAHVREAHKAWVKMLEESAKTLRQNGSLVSIELLPQIEAATRALKDSSEHE